MCSDVNGAIAITDVNYRIAVAAGVPASFAEVWAVDAEELRRGSSAGLGQREAGLIAGMTRWQWVAKPPFDHAEVASALTAAVGLGPRVVRICPGTEGHRFPLASWLLAPLPELCDEANIAVALDYGPLASLPWDEVVELARRHPSLCLVLLGRGTGELGVVRACLDAVPNVIFDISALGDAGWLGRTVAEVGAHRFMFGSGEDPTGAVGLLKTARLASPETNMIGSGVAGSLDKGSWAEAWL